MELEAPVVLSLSGRGAIGFATTDVLVLVSATAGGRAEGANTAASFRTSEASSSGSGGGSAEADTCGTEAGGGT